MSRPWHQTQRDLRLVPGLGRGQLPRPGAQISGPASGVQLGALRQNRCRLQIEVTSQSHAQKRLSMLFDLLSIQATQTGRTRKPSDQQSSGPNTPQLIALPMPGKI